MPRDAAHEWLMQRVVRRARAQAEARRVRPGESLLTLMLATVSLGLGVVVLGAALGGIAGKPLAPWNESRQIWGAATPRQYTTAWDEESGSRILVPVMTVVASIHALSTAGVALALVGALLGVAGIALRRSRRRYSMLSVAGVAACFAGFVVGFAYELVMVLTH